MCRTACSSFAQPPPSGRHAQLVCPAQRKLPLPAAALPCSAYAPLPAHMLQRGLAEMMGRSSGFIESLPVPVSCITCTVAQPLHRACALGCSSRMHRNMHVAAAEQHECFQFV